MTKSSNQVHNVMLSFLTCLLLGLSFSFKSYAQEQTGPFKGHFYEENEKIHLQINLYEPTLYVPGMDFLGKVNGYMHGNIYGMWMMTSHKIKKDVATLRFSNDAGADSQTIELQAINDSLLHYKAINGNCIKRVHKRKLIKIPNELTFKRVRK